MQVGKNFKNYFVKKAQQKEDAKNLAYKTYTLFKTQNISLVSNEGNQGKLPIDVWEHILRCIADDYEPDGIIGIHIVLKRLFIISQACKDSYMAMKNIVPLMKTEMTLESSLKEKINTFLHHPTRLTIPDMKEVLKFEGLRVTGTKPELIMRYYTAMQLKKPLPNYISASVFLSSFRERTSKYIDVSKDIYEAIQTVTQLENTRDIQLFSSAAEFHTYYSNRFTSSQELIKYSRKIKKDYDIFVAKGKEFIKNTLHTMNITGMPYLRYITEHDMYEYGKTDDATMIMKKLHCILKKTDLCKGCWLNTKSSQCPHKYCGRCCGGCTRHQRA